MTSLNTFPNDPETLAGSYVDRMLGTWSARAIAALSVPYAITMVLGFSSMGNLRDPLPDPYLAVAEVLILLMAPFMVTLMIAVHACAALRLRAFSLTGARYRWARRGLLTSGALCLLGLVGPAFNALAWRGIGI
ncbi:MAG: hypothetical protein QOE84_3324, partial [Actinomycetota bacterium]|nr:hypothetical protein [Actinomycetota bacterium]